ncbi:MAG: hypothetical protein HS132_08005 [Planctomycetia bacterium]|nr:hypothetical protein [Planctomycetia bacterium]
MLELNPKRSSRLITVIKEWRDKLETIIDDKDAKFIFSFMLRDPFDGSLHMCVDLKTIYKSWEELRIIYENNKESLTNYIREKLGSNSYYEILDKELMDSKVVGNDYIIAFLSLWHVFPFPLTPIDNNQDNLNEPNEFTCIDDSLYFYEESRNVIFENIVDVSTKNLEFKFEITGKEITCTQKPSKHTTTQEKMVVLDNYLQNTKFITNTETFEQGFGIWLPIRNGKGVKKGRILGFVNFICKNEELKNYVKEYLQNNFELIHFQLNTAFFEGTLFEIEEEVKEIADTNLLEKTDELIKRILFIPEGDRCKKDINVCYADIPYEYKKKQNSSILEFKNGLPVDCNCNYISKNNCTEDCKIYQKSKILELIIKLVQKKDREKEILKHGTKTARATIISGSVSHNIGSHVLSSIDEKVIETRRPDVERLISYVQQRMDYIAGVTSDYPLWSEPTFFFFDLLEGFFQQGLLLDYITNDDGVPGEKIKFHVKYKNSQRVYRRARIIQLANGNNVDETEKPCWGSDEVIEKKINFLSKKGYKVKDKKECEFKTFSENEEDFLVSIPGGVIGRHAFYALLENFMRNGAKYGNEELKKSAIYYHVSLEIEEKNEYFEVKLYDNWSKKEGLVNDIQEKIKKPIVQNDGSPTPGDWGIQEMKISADYLASPHITERVEDGTIPEDKEFSVNTENNKKYRIWAEKQDCNKIEVLSYKFILQKSTLVAVANFNGELQQEGDLSKGVVIKSVSSEENLLKLVKEFSPQLLIIRPPENQDKLSSLLKYLKENHVSFPSRVLLCVDNDAKIDGRNGKINNIQGIAPRRYLAGKWPKLDDSDWEKFIINVYKEWIIRLRKLENGKKLNLVVYFKRVKTHKTITQWQEIIKEVQNSILQEIVDITLIHVEYKDEEIKTLLKDGSSPN